MTDRELLEKVLNEISGVKTELGGMKTELGGMKTELGDVKSELNTVKSKVSEIERRTRRLEVLIENDIPKHIKTIAEQHGDIIEKLNALDDYPATRGRVATLEHVVQAHTQDISKLKKAVG